MTQHSDTITAQMPVVERWHKGQLVAHRITNRVGEVVGVDFEESLAVVAWRGDDGHDTGWTAASRMENLWEVKP